MSTKRISIRKTLVAAAIVAMMSAVSVVGLPLAITSSLPGPVGSALETESAEAATTRCVRRAFGVCVQAVREVRTNRSVGRGLCLGYNFYIPGGVGPYFVYECDGYWLTTY